MVKIDFSGANVAAAVASSRTVADRDSDTAVQHAPLSVQPPAVLRAPAPISRESNGVFGTSRVWMRRYQAGLFCADFTAAVLGVLLSFLLFSGQSARG